jgi:heat shock protein HtpX
MVFALALVAVAYAAVAVPVAIVVAAFVDGPLADPATAGTVLGWTAGVVAVGVGLLMAVADALVLFGTDARDLPRDHPLYDRVGRLARGVDLAVPDLAVVPSDEPNAFTLGGVGGPMICVTTGLLETLEGAELDAVLAHELAHVKHRDALVMTVAAFPMTAALLAVASGSDVAGWGDLRVAVPGVLAAAIGLVFLLVTLPPVIVLSRYREFAADRGAVAITGDPAALVTAVRTLADWSPSSGTDAEGDADTDADPDLRRIATLSAFCVVPPVDGVLVGTHPSTEARIDRLRALTRATESA